MSTTVVLPELAFAPQNTPNHMQPSAQSVARFEQLMFAPNGNAAASATPGALTLGGVGDNRLQVHLQRLSDRWEAGQSAVNRLASRNDVSAKDLIVTQMQMINCALDVEVSSKCASVFENGVQTLTQRA
ncbi:hypothetical protein GCM10011487_43870 [Steroidobacter agaridevorans]|uniref:Type III secretion protein n=1 Tax=Steroidobacter agaridevorans TaxID=2695856 RepID=A0A829YGD5_9GAMM|nr:hypothetical protein [Steroidobacter agaridevorans]GFE82387.1 hypothetical protein GCM10011487_43870 [Steroidobacter agaridevorans]GFE85224.1 hypothetical protein GCM10011488_01780 [Steroidobacter agaridevorans]